MLWVPGSPEIVFGVGSAIVAMLPEEQNQRYLLGHSDAVCALACSADGTLLASAEEGRLALIRLWDLPSGACISILNGEPGCGTAEL